MIQGVHGDTVVFAPFEAVAGLVVVMGWPWFSSPGATGMREFEISGKASQRLNVVVGERHKQKHALDCQLEIRDPMRQNGVVMKLDLRFTPSLANTRVSVTGSARSDLAPFSAGQAALSRRLANEFARVLLDRLASDLEASATLPTTR